MENRTARSPRSPSPWRRCPMSEVEMILVPPQGAAKVVQVDTRSLAALQGLVGGYIEAIGGPGWSAYLDEEGKIKGLPVNMLATYYAVKLGWVGMPNDMLVGPVLFCGQADANGYDTPVSKRVKRLIFD